VSNGLALRTDWTRGSADLTAFADLPLLVDLAIDVPLPADA